jgi:3-oxoacyl-[acyl-carrier-protein] synthase I
MSEQALAILASGMVSGVGLNAPASCAAIRCGIDNVQETRFMDSGGEWIMGSSVPMEKPWRGTEKLSKMLASALQECVSSDSSLNLEEIPVIICLAEKGYPFSPGHFVASNTYREDLMALPRPG